MRYLIAKASVIGSVECMGARLGPAVPSLGTFLPEPVGTRDSVFPGRWLSHLRIKPAQTGWGGGMGAELERQLGPTMPTLGNCASWLIPPPNQVWFLFL